MLHACDLVLQSVTSRPARGGWIEIAFCRIVSSTTPSPVPRGAGGLKSENLLTKGRAALASRPARGGWIEIRKQSRPKRNDLRPVPRGAGGLKCHFGDGLTGQLPGPVPRGAGGLK